MSLEVQVSINGQTIGHVDITRASMAGESPNSFNAYRWNYTRDGQHKATGRIDHRYGDGALELARKVLEVITTKHRIATQARPEGNQ